MAALPSGDESYFGVTAVQASVRSLEKALDMPAAEVAKRVRTLRGYADDLVQYCNPAKNPVSFRNCQAVAGSSGEGLLRLAQSSASQDMRITALTALTCICLNNVENASTVVASENFKPMHDQALRPIIEIRQQEEVLALLQLLQAICAVSPEAPALIPLMPRVVALLVGAEEGHAACSAVRMTAIEVLVSFSLSHQRRSKVACLLPESVLTTLINDVEVDGATMAFPLGLLLANLSDLFSVSQSANTVLSDLGFNKIINQFWEQTGFLGDLLSCLEASLNSEPWPPQSGIYHMPWKLASTYLRLSRAGFRDGLHGVVPSLVALVERWVNNECALSSDDARAACFAVDVLLEISADAASLEQMRLSLDLPRALLSMQAQEPAAANLLQLLTKESSISPGHSEGQLSYVTAAAKPW